MVVVQWVRANIGHLVVVVVVGLCSIDASYSGTFFRETRLWRVAVLPRYQTPSVNVTL